MIHLWYWFRRRHASDFKPVILVTGCGSGVGRSLIELLYQKTQYRVVATARPDSLAGLHQKFPENERFWIRALDVRVGFQREKLISEIESKWGAVNILINNAGVSYRSVVEHMSEEDEFLQMSTNYLGPVGLIRQVLPRMRELGRGKIINVSSVSGMLAMPTMSSYSASKYALEGMSEALWYELKPLGVNVCLIQPGFIRSNSFKNVYYSKKSKMALDKQEAYSDYYENMAPFVEKLMSSSLTTPEKIAHTILKAIQTQNPPLWIPATLDAWLFYYIRRMLPRRLLLPILFMALPGAKNWAKDYTNRR